MATDRLKKKARDVIGEECKGTILREFPSEWLEATLAEIDKAAKRGERSARKAWKLLSSGRFKK